MTTLNWPGNRSAVQVRKHPTPTSNGEARKRESHSSTYGEKKDSFVRSPITEGLKKGTRLRMEKQFLYLIRLVYWPIEIKQDPVRLLTQNPHSRPKCLRSGCKLCMTSGQWAIYMIVQRSNLTEPLKVNYPPWVLKWKQQAKLWVTESLVPIFFSTNFHRRSTWPETTR